jgi:acyl-CoA reductase-like NAD-dependent aldehyde dehydrogenase
MKTLPKLSLKEQAPAVRPSPEPREDSTHGRNRLESNVEDRTYNLLINGDLVAGASTFDVINPATGKAFAQCPKADAAQLEQAVAAAKNAFPAWAATSTEDRAAKVEALAAALEARAEEFAQLLTTEQGKPLEQAMGEVIFSTIVLRAFRDARIGPKVLRDAGGNKVIEHRVPLGVVAAITPWNFPLVLLIQKLGPALISGNTVVIKPAPSTPLTTLLLGELCAEILPAGVVNVICDQNDLGAALTNHPDVAKIAFTGSTATGKKVMASAAAAVKRVTLELGGNDAAIVLDDVDPKLAALKVYNGAMANAGQICVAIKRAYVPSAIYDEFCDEVARLANAAVVGDGAEPGTQVGPIQNKAQFDKVCALIDDARGRGRIIAGGKPLDRQGYFVPPTIVRDLPDDAPLVREEQFGPVLPILRYDDIDDVIARANDSEFGLGGTVWGKDVARATEVALRINTGTVWVNQHLAFDPGIPFRGVKQSGFGAELGEAGLHEYSQAHIVNAVELS